MSNSWDDAFEAVNAIEDLTLKTYKTPGAGKRSRSFKVSKVQPEQLIVGTSGGGTVALRTEAFVAGVKVLHDRSQDEAVKDGWIRVSDKQLVSVLQAENRDKPCASYVLPLLAEAGKIELERNRPGRARIAQPAS